jgi:riboflavin synthase
MRVGIVQVAGNEKLSDIVEEEFNKEISTLEVKRVRIPSIDSAPLGTRLLLEDGKCDIAIIPYQLKDDEKLGIDFNLGVSLSEFWLKKPIFKIIVYPNEDAESVVRGATREIINYKYNIPPAETKESQESSGGGSPFGMFNNF